MKVSIIIPVYNVSLYIKRCLYSVLRQSYSEIECIIVNDASQDDSMEKVNEVLINQNSNISFKIVSHPFNRGLSAARNTGVKNSMGEYLFFLDSDDEITSDCIEKLLSYLNNSQADIVIGELSVIGGNRKKYSLLLLDDGRFLEGSDILDAFLRRKWYEMAWNKLVRRSIFFEKKCWFYEGIVHEDNLWSFYLALNSSSMIICQHPTYIYHIHPGTITTEKRRLHFDSMLVVMSEMKKKWKTKEFSSKTMRRCFFDYLVNLKVYFMKSLLKGEYDLDFVKEEYIQIMKIFADDKLDWCFSSLLLRVKSLFLECVLKIRLR